MKKILKFLEKNLLIISIIIILLIILFKTKYEGFAHTNVYDIVIIAGQSNAVGNGLQDFYKPNQSEPLLNVKYFSDNKDNINPPSTSDNIRNRIKSFDSSNQIVIAKDPIEHFPETTIKYNQQPQGFGISFAKQYVKEKNKDIMLLGCAMGSTAFNYFGPANGGTNDKTGKNYGWQEGNNNNNNICDGNNCSLFKMSKLRIDNLRKKISDKSKVVAILWHQGEQDSRGIGDGSSYKSGVAKMLKDLRSYAKSKFTNSEPNFPILMGGLCTRDDTIANTMNPIIQDIVKTNTTSNFKFVPSDSSLGSSISYFNHELLPNGVKNDGEKVHFSRMGQIEFGYRYFYVFNNSINFNK